MAFTLEGPSVRPGLSQVPAVVLSELAAECMTAHRLRGYVKAWGDEWLIGFRCRSAEHARDFAQGGRIVAFRWDGFFGSGFSFSTSSGKAGKKEWASRAWLNARHPAAKVLRDRRAMTFVPVYGGKAVAVIRATLARESVQIQDKDVGFTTLTDPSTEDANRAGPLIAEDDDLCYWELFTRIDIWDHLLSIKDHLQIGWAKEFSIAMGDLKQMIDGGMPKLAFDPDFPIEAISQQTGYPAERLIEAVLPAMRALLGRTCPLETVRKLDVGGVMAHLFAAFNDPERDPLNPIREPVAQLLECANLADTRTGFGTRYVSLLTFNEHGSIELPADSLPDAATAKRFWRDLPGAVAIGVTSILSRRRIPADIEKVAEGLAQIHLASPREEIKQAIKALAEEANILNRWTVPWGARVQVNVGPFTQLQLFPQDDEIGIFLLTTEGQFRWGSFNLRKDSWNFIHLFRSRSESSSLEHEQVEDVELAIKLLVSAIVRDFVVVEERERAFSISRVARGSSGRERADSIIYLPRVRYLGAPNVAALASDLEYQSRRPHHVQAHMRQAPRSSEHQQILAERYGFALKPGYTFVRPHHRGGLSPEREAIYRSRSAMQSLYSVAPEVGGNARSKWFQFERDVYAAMKASKYRVDHIASARSGDNGIDVYAESNDGREFWAIQCKCYALNRPVGPSVVRELIGALSRYPAHTRGMIVTTSTFTAAAITAANAAGIELCLMSADGTLQPLQREKSAEPG